MADQVKEFVDAVLVQLERILSDLPNWGLTKEGEKMVRRAVHKFRWATITDAIVAQMYKIDVLQALQDRLENILALRETVLEHIQAARDVKWLGSWMEEATGEPTFGVLQAINPSQSGKNDLPN